MAVCFDAWNKNLDLSLFTDWGWKPVCPDQSAVDIQCSI